MAITPGGRVGDASPLGTHGPRRLDDYVREVAHALMRKGYSKSHAIAVAKNSLKRWRRGGGHVRPQVRAGAAAHLGIQEGLDKSRSFNMANSLASSQDGPRGTVASVASPAFGGKKAAPFKKGGGKAKLRPGSIPAGKGKGKFPITDQKSVQSAANLLSKAKGVSRAAVVAHVRAEAKRRGLKLTPAFKPKQTDSSNVFDLVGPKGYSHGWIRAGGPLPRGKRGGKSRAAVGLVPSGARTKGTPIQRTSNPVLQRMATSPSNSSAMRAKVGQELQRRQPGLPPAAHASIRGMSDRALEDSLKGAATVQYRDAVRAEQARRSAMAGHAAPTPDSSMTGVSESTLRLFAAGKPKGRVGQKVKSDAEAELRRRGLPMNTPQQEAHIREQARVTRENRLGVPYRPTKDAKHLGTSLGNDTKPSAPPTNREIIRTGGLSAAEARKKVADALRSSPTTPDNPTAYVGRASTAQLQALLSDKRYASWRGLIQAELDKRKKA